MKFVSAVSVLRIFVETKVREFYVDFFDFQIDWEHRFEAEHAFMHADLQKQLYSALIRTLRRLLLQCRSTGCNG